MIYRPGDTIKEKIALSETGVTVTAVVERNGVVESGTGITSTVNSQLCTVQMAIPGAWAARDEIIITLTATKGYLTEPYTLKYILESQSVSAVATPATAAAAILATPANKLATDGSGRVTVGSIANDAVTAAALKADAVAEIQSGLATGADAATIQGYVDTLEASATAITAAIAAVQATSDTINTNTDAVEGALDTLQAALVIVQNYTDTVETVLAALPAATRTELATELGLITDNLDAPISGIEIPAPDLGDIPTQVETIYNQLQAVAPTPAPAAFTQKPVTEGKVYVDAYAHDFGVPKVGFKFVMRLTAESPVFVGGVLEVDRTISKLTELVTIDGTEYGRARFEVWPSSVVGTYKATWANGSEYTVTVPDEGANLITLVQAAIEGA